MKIAVFTGSRADYGVLKKLLRLIDSSQKHELSIIASGSHLSNRFGNTQNEIIKDGFHIDESIRILLDSTEAADVVKSTGMAFIGLADVFSKNRPDLLIVLGDRYEAFACASSAFLMNIPIAHIAGGEVTEGALDDGLRHAITKLSSLHFASTDEYARRIIQLGEPESSVYVVGATGLDNFEDIATEKEISSDFPTIMNSTGPLVLCTYHPETKHESTSDSYGVNNLLAALDIRRDLRIIFTMSNADEGGGEINDSIATFVSKNSERSILVANLGQKRYLSLLHLADVIVGNSSSGIIEAPTAGTVTLNIGARQKGRLRAPSVLDVDNEIQAILNGFEKALDIEMKKIAKRKVSPFGSEGASERIFDILNNLNTSSINKKPFEDLNWEPHEK